MSPEEIISSLSFNREERERRNAKILAEYASQKPYTHEELKETALVHTANLVPCPPSESEAFQVAIVAETILEGERTPRAGNCLSPPADR